MIIALIQALWAHFITIEITLFRNIKTNEPLLIATEVPANEFLQQNQVLSE